MVKYKLKTGELGKQAVEGFNAMTEGVKDGYKNIEENVASTYQAVEGGVVRAYKKIEQKFIDRFLEEVSEDILDEKYDR